MSNNIDINCKRQIACHFEMKFLETFGVLTNLIGLSINNEHFWIYFHNSIYALSIKIPIANFCDCAKYSIYLFTVCYILVAILYTVIMY